MILFLLGKSRHLCNIIQTKHIGTSSTQAVHLKFCHWTLLHLRVAVKDKQWQLILKT